jgi:hypothetical protein
MHPSPPIMWLAIIPGLVSVVLFVATLSLRPTKPRATLLPPAPTFKKA